MDSLINILRKSTTPSEGVDPADEYNNGAGFFNPLAWSDEGRPEGGIVWFPSNFYAPRHESLRSLFFPKNISYERTMWLPDINGTEYVEEVKNGETTGFYDNEEKRPVDPESLRQNISDKTNGRITVSDNITNPKAMKDISDTVDKIVDRWGQDFLPNGVTIGDSSRSVGISDALKNWDNLLGVQYNNGVFRNYIRWQDTDDTKTRWVHGNWGRRYDGTNFHPHTLIDPTPAHELGHTVNDSIGKQWPNSLLERLRWARDMEDAYGVSQTAPTISPENISEYATASPKEAFAEAFADVVLNGESASLDSLMLVDWYKELAESLPKEKEKVLAQNPFDRETAYARMENILNGRSTLNP